MPRSIVEFHKVGKTYLTGLLRRTPLEALRNVSFNVPAGSVFAVIGPNRAGKTTLVKALLSICKPTAGYILRLGKSTDDRATLAKIGYVHECQAFPQYLTAQTLLRYYGALSLVSKQDLDKRIPRLLDEVGLADRAGEPISRFSKGMGQRLALAQSLVNDPELLVLDEPAEGMDLLAQKMLTDILKRRQRAGKTAILVSHSMADVGRLCDLVVMLREGQVAFNGSLSELTGEKRAGSSAKAFQEALQEALEPMYEGASK